MGSGPSFGDVVNEPSQRGFERKTAKRWAREREVMMMMMMACIVSRRAPPRVHRRHRHLAV